MRNTILIITFLTLLSCENPIKKTEFECLKVKNINEIIQIVIIEDSLNVWKNKVDSRMLCEELIKLDIYIPEKTKDGIVPPPPPPSFNNVSIENILHYRNSGLFSSKDSMYLLKQNSNPHEFKIDEAIIQKINLTTKEKEMNKKKTKKSFNFYEMTIPIFSLDNQKAYLELNYYCGALCGSGKSIYLKKINEKWKIVQKRGTWISLKKQPLTSYLC